MSVAAPTEEALPCAQDPVTEPLLVGHATTVREAFAQLELVAALSRQEAPQQTIEPPFDAPNGAEWMLEGAVEIVHTQPVTDDAPEPPPFDLGKPVLPPPPPRVSDAERRDVLRRARLAAQAHGQALQQQQAQMRARLFGGGAYGVGLGLAACAAIGAMLLLNTGDEAPAPLAPRAEAATLTATSVPLQRRSDQAETYAAALRLLEQGRADAGARQMQRAAEGGFVLAQYRLSKLYERGEGVPRSLALALQWAERAAEGGNVLAMHDVGVFYARGELGAPDEAAAFRWFRQAADFGIADSQYNLGVLYLQGRGVSADAREALFWFLVAAHNDDANAIDRAVAVAAILTPSEVTHMRERSRAFRPRAPNPDANALQS